MLCVGTVLLQGAGECVPTWSGCAGDIQRPPTVSACAKPKVKVILGAVCLQLNRDGPGSAAGGFCWG